MKKMDFTYRLFHPTAMKVVFVIVFICYILSHFLATERIVLGRCDAGLVVFSNYKEECTSYLAPVVKMGPETILEVVDPYKKPLSRTPGVGIHLMGTDGLGRDVFSGIVHGGRKSINIAVMAALCAVCLGWFFGIFSAFYSRMDFAVTFQKLLIVILFIGIAIIAVYGGTAFGILVLLAAIFLLKWLYTKTLKIKPGRSIARGIEWYQALPDLLILLVLSAVIRIDSQIVVAVIIAMVSWPNFALLARRESYEIMEQPYFRQGLRNKISYRRLLVNYLFKNSSGLLLALLPLTIGRFILLESTLSFLGLGLPPDVVTIGSMVNEGKDYLKAWWLIVFSGMFIFVLILSLQRLGYRLVSLKKVGLRNN